MALGFCRSKDLKTLKTSKTYYFHAIESNNTVKDFPSGILDATRLLVYSGGRSKPINLTGHYGAIKSIELKHKSKIKGKENFKNEMKDFPFLCKEFSRKFFFLFFFFSFLFLVLC